MADGIVTEQRRQQIEADKQRCAELEARHPEWRVWTMRDTGHPIATRKGPAPKGGSPTLIGCPLTEDHDPWTDIEKQMNKEPR